MATTQASEILDPANSPEIDKILEYAMPGDPPFYQVEPEASYWSRCRYLCIVTRQEVYNNIGTVRAYPTPNSPEERKELAEIRMLQSQANDDFDAAYRRDKLSAFLQDERYIRPWPAGAALNRRGNPSQRMPGTPIVKNGAELATLFESETPGLWHRHVLNVVLGDKVDPADPNSPTLAATLSPPRQALLWDALDTAISSALNAVWHYKWLATGLNQVARRRRPWEADQKPILYDYEVSYDSAGTISRDKKLKTKPHPSPGTPRHPAYGSGHSTYSAAASYVLACLLPDRYKSDFDKLANNIGEARIWGGVHWRTDHVFGQQIGEVIGRLIIGQLNRSGIAPKPSQLVAPPERGMLEKDAKKYEASCGNHNNDFCGSFINKDNLQGDQG